MGRGIKAGKKSKDVKLASRIKKQIRIYETEEREAFVKQVREDIAKEVTESIMYHHNIDMLSVMFALRDEFKFGKDRIIRVIKKAAAHADYMYREKMDVDELLAILEEETGVAEDDLIFDEEVPVEAIAYGSN